MSFEGPVDKWRDQDYWPPLGDEVGVASSVGVSTLSPMTEEAAVTEIVKLRYEGPDQQVCYALGGYGYPAALVPDKVYELPAEFAKSLRASNPNFSLVAEIKPTTQKVSTEKSKPEAKSSSPANET